MKNIPRFLFVFAVILSFSGITAFAPVQQDGSPQVRITQIDTSGFPRVTVYISAVDAQGNPVAVDPSRLVLMENGEVIPLDQIQGVGEVGPLTTLLVMDLSGSMNSGDKLDAAKAAAREYVNQMRPGDQAGLLTFNTRTNYVQPITADHQALLNAIDGMTARDNTAMYDALLEAVDILEEVGGRKAIIVLTDGLDNVSQATPDQIIAQIGPAGLSISTIGLGEPNQGPGALTALDEDALQSLASQAGGVYGFAEDEDSLRRLYQTYAIAMQSEYVVTYTSPSALRDGVNRSLSVSLAAVGGAEAAQGQDTVYNPGGLVPEVAEPAPWPQFILILGGLILLLLAPLAFGVFSGLAGKASGKVAGLRPAPKTRIKLKD